MMYSQAKQGRTFIIRLEDGDILHECIESLAEKENVQAGYCLVLGGADKGSLLITGPKESRVKVITPMQIELGDMHEVTGSGTLFPDASGKTILHMHIAAGRGEEARCGCIRRGVKVWHVMEVILQELVDTSAQRLKDEITGFELLVPDSENRGVVE